MSDNVKWTCARVGCKREVSPSDPSAYCAHHHAMNIASGITPADPPAPRTVTEERWGWWDVDTKRVSLHVDVDDEAEARELADMGEIPVRVTLTYNVPEEP